MVLKCPKCKSANITLYMGGQFGKYQCKKCGYVGSLVLEEYEDKKIKTKVKKRKNNNIKTYTSV